MGEAIVITSGKGGVGKSTLTANLGAVLAKQGKTVLVIDTNLGLRNLDLFLGLENQIIYNLVDVIHRKCKLKDALLPCKDFPQLHFLPAAQTKDPSSISPEEMKELIEELKNDYDYLFLDCPSGIEQGFQNAIAGADKAILIATLDPASIRDADRMLRLLETKGIRQCQLLINRFRVEFSSKENGISLEELSDLLPVDLLGVIPEDDQLYVSSIHGKNVVGEECPAGQALQNVCRRFLGESIPIQDFQAEQGGLLHRFKHFFKK